MEIQLEKKQVEKCFCLVGHGSAVPLHYLHPGKKLLSSAGLQRNFAASSARKNCDKEKKGELALQREEIISVPGLFLGCSWAVPSECEQTGSGSDL